MDRLRDKPSWLHEDCPSWCTVDHDEADHPDDRKHRNDAKVLPVVLASRLPGRELPTAAECVVELSRRVGERETWVYVGEAEGAEHRMVLARPSAIRIAEEILAVITAATP